MYSQLMSWLPRKRSFFAAALLVGIAVSVHAQPTVTFSIYPVPGLWGAAPGITTGPDGALWFTAGSSIWRMTTAGVLNRYQLPESGNSGGNGAYDITVGPDGALWFTEANTAKIGRITTAGTLTEYPISATAGSPSRIVSGSDGALWFTEYIGTNGRVGRITTGGTITEYPLPCLPHCDDHYPRGITAGPDGALWFTDINRPNIWRITTSGAISGYGLFVVNGGGVGSVPGDITVGPDGALWFTAEDSSGPHDYIGRITTGGAVLGFPLPIYERPTYNGYNNLAPNSIVAGPDGALWFTSQRVNVLGRITTNGQVNLYDLPPVEYGNDYWWSRSLTVGPDGALWITNQGCIVRVSLGSDTKKPTSHVVPLPPTESTNTFLVQWTGTDTGGSGLRDYTIYVSDNGAQVVAWLPQTTVTQANFTGVFGHTYSFYSIARDNAGNREDPKYTFEATTHIVGASPPSTNANIRGFPGFPTWHLGPATVTLIATAGSNPVAVTYYSLDGGPYQVYIAPFSVSDDGVHHLSFYSADTSGLQETPHSLVINIDSTPPAISGMPGSSCVLWPPNQQLVKVAVVRAQDTTAGLVPGSFTVSGVSSESSDPKAQDVEIIPDGSGGFIVELRASRLGNGTGRVYTLQAAATDMAGNRSIVNATCVVPHDQR